MNKLAFLLFLYFISPSLFSQRWELYQNDLMQYKVSAPSTVFGRSIVSDTLAITLKLDTVLNYSSRKITIFEKDFSKRDSASQWGFCSIYSPSVFGDSLVAYSDSSIYYSGSHQFVWKEAPQWTFFTSASNDDLLISLDSVYSMNGDSLKRYSFSAANSAAFNSALFSIHLVVSKTRGMLYGLDLSVFPSTIKPITYFHSGPITTAEIYNLEIGDEYHYQVRTSFNLSFTAIDQFIKKVIGKQYHGQDSVTYTFERQVTDDQLVVVNNNPFPSHQYSHFQDTVLETHRLTDTILSGRYLDGFSLPITPLTTGSLGVFNDGYDTPTFVDFSGFGRTADTICDFTFELETYSTFIFGIGMFNHLDNGDPTNYYLNSEELVYYKKGTKIWGNPLVIPVGISEKVLSNISFYPNPIKDQLYIDNLKEDVNYELISVNGALIKRGVLTSGSKALSLNDINTGIYFLQLRTSEEFKTIKLVKE